jgi:deoxyribonuclease-4
VNVLDVRFGPAGNPDSFYEQGYKSSLDMPSWLAEQGLNAYEYQCGRGVRIKEEFAQKLGENARKYDIALSIHAPYYINLCSEDEKIIQKSKEHIVKSVRAAKWMGADVVVLHIGSAKGGERALAYNRAKDYILKIIEEIEEELNGVKLAPETMGKINQIGSLDEVLEMCALHNSLVPCIDFAHLHAVSGGKFNDVDSFKIVFEKIKHVLGKNALQNLHIHFSPIEYTKLGEKRHRTTLDKGFGPDFKLLAELIVKENISARIICESDGRQSEDALVYKGMLECLTNYTLPPFVF